MGIFVIKKDNFLLKLVVFFIGGAQNKDIWYALEQLPNIKAQQNSHEANFNIWLCVCYWTHWDTQTSIEAKPHLVGIYF